MSELRFLIIENDYCGDRFIITGSFVNESFKSSELKSCWNLRECVRLVKKGSSWSFTFGNMHYKNIKTYANNNHVASVDERVFSLTFGEKVANSIIPVIKSDYRDNCESVIFQTESSVIIEPEYFGDTEKQEEYGSW